MIKFLPKIKLNLKLFSSVIFLLGLITPWRSLALPEREVITRLENIPLFGIVNEQGQLNSYLFVNPQQALSNLREIQNTEPQRATNLRMAPIPLSTVYRSLQTIQSQNSELPPLIVPDQNSVDLATRLLRSNGQTVNDPRSLGIPLFVATIGSGGEERWLVLSSNNGNESYIPFYFDKNEADQIVEKYKRDNPNQISPVQVRVFSLGYVVGLLLGSNNPAVQMMQIVPSREQIDYANRLLNP